MAMEYLPRIVDGELRELLQGLPAISLDGAKAVGKTATASRLAASILELDDPQTREAVTANPDIITQLPRPVLIDEWQLEPPVWDRVRRAVDNHPGEAGMFLLAGSSSVDPAARIHSGAGRIVRRVMRPLTIAERGIEKPSVSLGSVCGGQAEVKGETGVSVGDYVDEILASGFPGIRRLAGAFREAALDGYLSSIVERDLDWLGVAVRKPASLMGWLRAYAAATSSSASYAKILDAATPNEADKPSRPATEAYREHLTRLFVLDPLPAWTPTFSPLKRLIMAQKHHLVDPALAARLVGVGREGLLVGEGQRVSGVTGSWLGALFESLVVQSVRVYAESHGFHVGHLRTANGAREIDLIIEGPGMECVAIEVKLAPTVSDSDVKHLHWLKDQLGNRLKDALVVNTGKRAYRRPDGIGVVPFSLLGP